MIELFGPLETFSKVLVAVALLLPSVPSTAQESEQGLCDHLSELQSLNDSDLILAEEIIWEEGKRSLDGVPGLGDLLFGEVPQGFLYYRIGECYLFGRSVAKDSEIALRYFEQASARGYADADHLIASILVFKSADVESQRRGIAMLQAEFEAGSWYAAGKLGWAYQRGLGVTPDLNKALELYRGAAKRGGTYWQYLLSHAHKMGYLGLERSEEMALYWKSLPKTHIDTYDCWVRTYYSDGTFPPNDQLQSYYKQRCLDPAARRESLARVLNEQEVLREKARQSRGDSAVSNTEGG